MRDSGYRSVKKILWIILFANFLVAAIKICVGIFSHSNSVMADGIHSVADGSSNIVGLLGIWLASKPRDERHPYGHDKFEIIASLFIGAMLAFISVRIIYRAVLSFRAPVELAVDFIQLILMVFTIIVNIIVSYTEYRQGKKLGSMILVTDSLHTRGDIMISCAVLLGLICVRAGLPCWVDGIISILVAVAVLVSAWQIIKNCVDILVDCTAVDSREVRKVLMTIPGIYDVHQIRSRGLASHAFIDLHVVVNPLESVEAVHALSHRLEETLKEYFGSDTEVNIHIEPDDGKHTDGG